MNSGEKPTECEEHQKGVKCTHNSSQRAFPHNNNSLVERRTTRSPSSGRFESEER